MSYEELIDDLNNLSIKDKEPTLTIIKGGFCASNINGNWIPCNNKGTIFYFEYKIVIDLILEQLDDERIIDWIFTYGDTAYIGVWNEAVFKAKMEIISRYRHLQHVIDGLFIKIRATYD